MTTTTLSSPMIVPDSPAAATPNWWRPALSLCRRELVRFLRQRSLCLRGVTGSLFLLPIGLAACSPAPMVREQPNLSTAPAMDHLLVDVLGTKVGDQKWTELTSKYGMRQIELNGDPDLTSSDRGLEIISRRGRVWRVVIDVAPAVGASSRPFGGPLPLGITQGETQATLVDKLGQPHAGPPVGTADNWIVYNRDGVTYVFCFRDITTLEMVMIEPNPISPGSV